MSSSWMDSQTIRRNRMNRSWKRYRWPGMKSTRMLRAKKKKLQPVEGAAEEIKFRGLFFFKIDREDVEACGCLFLWKLAHVAAGETAKCATLVFIDGGLCCG